MALFGKDTSFYDVLEAQSDIAAKAAKSLLDQLSDLTRAAEFAQIIKDLEHEGDALSRKLFNKTDATFVTPLDKEDLHALAGALDDVTDHIEAAAARVSLYEFKQSRPDVEPLVKLLVEVTAATSQAVKTLRDLSKSESFQPLFNRIHELEDNSDIHFRQALAKLFNAPDADPINVLKWKEIYDRVEKAVDKCANVANVIDGVRVKYA